MSDLWKPSELRRWPLAGLVECAYKLLGARRRWSVAAYLLGFVQRFEGGFVRSATARKLMSQVHGVEIGSYSYGVCFHPRVCPRGVTVGRYVSIGPGVRFLTGNHPLEALSTHPFFYEPGLGVVDQPHVINGELFIGHDAWLGANAIITPGCRRVGVGAVVAAGAVVTKNVPDFAVVGGIPAKVIRYRYPEQVRAKVLVSKWWELSIDQLMALGIDPTTPMTPESAEQLSAVIGMARGEQA